MSDYRREDVLRIFGIGERQLRLWERNGLIASGDLYGFQELAQVRRLRELGAHRISAGSIRDAVAAMRLVSGLPEPLLEAGVSTAGTSRGRLVFRFSGAVVEPIAGQYLFDFNGTGRQKLVPVMSGVLSPRELEREVNALFAAAVRAEELGLLEDAITNYELILGRVPGHAASAINLGTLYYNRRDYLRAEQLYRMATESDANYALAFFDLGNVLDELKRVGEAVVAYQRALALQPRYADAHYNLALALERTGKRRQALRHWRLYLQLDDSSQWARHARMQLRKILSEQGLTLLPGGRRSAQRVPREKAPVTGVSLRVV